MIFVNTDKVEPVAAVVHETLPDTYAGWPLAIGREDTAVGPKVLVGTLPDWVSGELGRPVVGEQLTSIDWLVLPQTRLLGITAGAVFVDATGELTALRDRLRTFPTSVWWWVIACQWQRLSQEEPFVQRSAEVGDELGSATITARQVRDCMRLALMIEHQYAPFSKWLGTAFATIHDPDGLGSALMEALTALTTDERERSLGRAYVLLGRRFNTLAPDLEVDVTVRSFFDRPAQVIGAERFAAAALARVHDDQLLRLPLIGAVDQLLDSTDALTNPNVVARMQAFYVSSEQSGAREAGPQSVRVEL